MENLSSVLRGLEPKGSEGSFSYNQVQAEMHAKLLEFGRCNNNQEAKLGHVAIFDARADVLFAQEEDEASRLAEEIG